MAAGIISKPGTEHGPCAESCEHRDCAASRAMAESTCQLCEKPIGYDVRMYRDPEKQTDHVHADCFEDQIG